MSRMADEVSDAKLASSAASLLSNEGGGVAQLGEPPPPIEMIAPASRVEPVKKVKKNKKRKKKRMTVW
jgi:hypothetical protein